MRKGGGAAQALGRLGVTFGKAHERVGRIVGYGEEKARKAPFTPRSKRVLEHSLREALDLGHMYIGTEHILLGLCREFEGGAARVLSNLDVDPDYIRREVLRLLRGASSEETVREPFRERGALRGRAADLEGGTGEAAAPDSTVFRVEIKDIEVRARSGAEERKVMVDVEYSYAVVGEGESEGAANHEAAIEAVADAFEGSGFESLEKAVKHAGNRFMDIFLDVVEIRVSAKDAAARASRPVGGVAVSFEARRER
jgi:ATP-dependent Clp protease ATP-binding subunit ClpA